MKLKIPNVSKYIALLSYISCGSEIYKNKAPPPPRKTHTHTEKSTKQKFWKTCVRFLKS